MLFVYVVGKCLKICQELSLLGVENLHMWNCFSIDSFYFIFLIIVHTTTWTWEAVSSWAFGRWWSSRRSFAHCEVPFRAISCLHFVYRQWVWYVHLFPPFGDLKRFYMPHYPFLLFLLFACWICSLEGPVIQCMMKGYELLGYYRNILCKLLPCWLYAFCCRVVCSMLVW